MKIAILGGAFDPPHVGHYLVAKQVLEQLKMDQVWFMVCYQYFPEFPVKYSHISSFTQRYAMTKKISTNSLITSDFEASYNKTSKTIDTLSLLKSQYPDDTFYWIIGSDQLVSFRLWNQWRDLVKNHKLIIFPRDTDLVTLKKRVKKAFIIKTIPENITVLESKELVVSNISSSIIRKRIRHGLSIDSMAHPKVEQYISKMKLYQSHEK